jgi:glyoxalase family protein
MTLISGLHHITAGVAGAQEDIDFFTDILGQRMIKQTVLFDGQNPVYHLYYGNGGAEPGTVMTTLPFRQVGYALGRRGSGQIKSIAYSVPAGSLAFWRERFQQLGVRADTLRERFGHRSLWFVHPSGLEFELIEDAEDATTGWTTDQIARDTAIRGFHSVVWSVRDTEEHERFLHEGLGFEQLGVDGPYTRFAINGGGAQRTLDICHEPGTKQGTWGFASGVIHHVAFAVPTEREQQEIKERLVGLGYVDVSEVKDRNYFHSVYVRSPGGILVELATSDIGFTIDERPEQLGQTLMVPPWWESRRAEFADTLEPIRTPRAGGRHG